MSFANLPIHIHDDAIQTQQLGTYGKKNLAKKVRTALEMKSDEIEEIENHTWII